MQAVLVDPLAEAVPAQWDEFAAAERLSALWRSDALVSAAWTAQSVPLMAVVLDAGSPVALFHGRFQGPNDIRRYHRPATAPPLGVVECRLAPASMAGHRFAAGLDPAGARAAVAAFERAVRNRFRWRVTGFCYRHVDAPALAAVRRPTRATLSVSPDTVLLNRWSTMDDYLGSLPAKWRSQLRGIRASVRTDGGLTARVAGTVPEAEAARLVNLVRGRYRRPGWVRPPISERYFRVLNADPGTRYVTYSDGPDLVALSTIHDAGTELTMSYWGIRDRFEGGRPNLYFDHYLDVVEVMVAEGHRALRSGKGMTHIKERFGASREANFLVVGR